MSKINNILENKIMPVAGRIAAQRHLQALRDGLILTMPLIIVGSLFLILGFIPIPGYADFMAGIFGEAWLSKLLYPVGATFDIMALIAAFGIAYRLAEKYGLDALSAGAISVAAFLLATPYQVSFLPEGAKEAILVGGAIPTALMGSKGLFVAMLVAMLSTEIYRFVVQRNIVIRMPDGVPPAVSKSFIALIPGFFVIAIIWILRLIIEQTSFASLHNIVGELLGKPLGVLGGSLIGSLVAVLLIQLLWSCGLHGASIVGGVMGPIWLSSMDTNRIAFQDGQNLPNIFTQQFFDIFIYVGGSGATLALVIAMLFWAKSQQMKQLGRLAIGPGLFNINEPITFGMPIVMNPLMIVPFILAPLVMVITTYIAMSTGLVAKPAGIAVPWTMPPIIGGYLAAGGKVSGAILQIVNFVICFGIYYPFFKMWDRQKLAEERGVSSDKNLDGNGFTA
ncbi:PTS cellobiose transporter subunit IIC [Bacillus sp. 7884-1]|uniref:PTS cellobiose transporter subunit IIC n=1 Tax=Bacillus sp. 7884-1 TaxID=2021693 RepID=UPI000BA70732|nr:PTS cellobiose transporter subunit IIC [Bacillus sp. 7884-1]PAE37884.1 PTS system, cellobiose-specific IIC component [Bacillus sp. 7884-1]